MGNIIRIIKWLENSGVLIDGIGKTVNNKIKQQGGIFLVHC